jgi:hypothetical protein
MLTGYTDRDDSQAYPIIQFSNLFLYKISAHIEFKRLKAVKSLTRSVPRVHTPLKISRCICFSS